MKTICEVHWNIKKICTQKYYNRLSFNHLNEEELRSIIWDFENALSDIYTLTEEATIMWQNMEDWLRDRKHFMIEKGLEEYYKSN